MYNIYLTFVQGNGVRDLLRLGMLDHLLELAPNARVVLLTPAWAVREFHEEFGRERVVIRRHELFATPGFWQFRLRGIRRRLRQRWLLDWELRLEARSCQPDQYLVELFQELPPLMVVATHPMVWFDWDVIMYARRLRVPTFGIVKSWDNLQKGLQARPERIAVWNAVNKKEAMELWLYHDDEVEITGTPAFDRYFDPEVIRPRDEFWTSVGLDPSKPVIMYATAGVFRLNRDETFLMDILLDMRRRNEMLKDMQIVCRLHPSSRLEYFWPYANEPGVHISFGSYIKTLLWSMTREEVDIMANMLCHANLVLTPASTVTIEAAIFDTPVILPIFSPIQPGHVKQQWDNRTFRRHFKPFLENNWVPIARSESELEEMMVRAIQDPGWFRQEREAIVHNYVPFRDSNSGLRVAQYISKWATRIAAGRQSATG